MAKAEIFMIAGNNGAIEIISDQPDLVKVTGVRTSGDRMKWRDWKPGSFKVIPNGIRLLRKIRARFVQVSFRAA